jgi:hypothetical protein
MSDAYVRWHGWVLQGNLWQRWLKNLTFFLPAFFAVYAIAKWQQIAAHSLKLSDFLTWPIGMAVILSASFAKRYRLGSTVRS